MRLTSVFALKVARAWSRSLDKANSGSKIMLIKNKNIYTLEIKMLVYTNYSNNRIYLYILYNTNYF